MFDKLKQLAEFRKQAEAIKKQLESVRIEVEEVEGIRLTVDGAQNFHAVTISDNLLGAENKARLEAGLLSSLQAAVRRSQAQAAQQMAVTMPKM